MSGDHRTKEVDSNLAKFGNFGEPPALSASTYLTGTRRLLVYYMHRFKGERAALHVFARSSSFSAGSRSATRRPFYFLESELVPGV